MRSKTIPKGLKYTLISILIIVVVLFAVLAFIIWDQCFNVVGLTFYKGEDIEEVYPFDYGTMYFVSEKGAYVSGSYVASDYLKYQNAKGKIYKDWQIRTPVLIFEGAVEKVVPYAILRSLIITDDGELYDFVDFETTKICDDAVEIYGVRGENRAIYVINSKNELYFYDESGADFICSDVTCVDGYGDRVFVNTIDGKLVELILSEDKVTVNKSEPLFENVAKFQVSDGEIFAVLTRDGDLYAKGTYQIQLWNSTYDTDTLSEWTLIYHDVVDFSHSSAGTAVLLEDGSVAYHGFGMDEDENVEFNNMTIASSDVSFISSSEYDIIALTNDKIMIWGGRYSYLSVECIIQEEHCVFKNDPYIIEK